MKRERYADFDVYPVNDKYTFIHLEIEQDKFYEMLINYFFDEKRLLKYITNEENFDFQPNKKNYTKLYKNIRTFIDKENEIISMDTFIKELEKFGINVNAFSKSKILEFRKDKSGKIGEYIFSVILLEYFKMTCIIPKLQLTTDPNMSVFGIDTLFYCKEQDMILFGESKFHDRLKQGINSINISLEKYEDQIEDEFRLVLSNFDIYPNMRGIDKYQEQMEISLSFKDFIDEASIKRIGIPIFVMHSDKKELEEIMKQLDTVNRKNYFDLSTTYYCISLPIVNKQLFQRKLVEIIKLKEESYANFRE